MFQDEITYKGNEIAYADNNSAKIKEAAGKPVTVVN